MTLLMEQENCFPIHFSGLPQAGKHLNFCFSQGKSWNNVGREIGYAFLKDNLCTKAI